MDTLKKENNVERKNTRQIYWLWIKMRKKKGVKEIKYMDTLKRENRAERNNIRKMDWQVTNKKKLRSEKSRVNKK